MDVLNERLCQLQQKVSRKHHLQIRVSALREQRNALQYKLAALQTSAMKEEANVARLEGRSLAAFYYNVIGQMDKKLDRERREAYAARVKCDAAVRELEAMEQDLERCCAELNSLSLCEERYRLCLEEKAASVKVSGQPDGLEILRLETLIQIQEGHLKELNEAMDAGKTALFTAKNIHAYLENAENLGSLDLLGGGNLSDMARYSHLDDAQAMVEKLQIQLHCFRTELADVQIDADLQGSVEGFSRFADFFFDGLFADWVVMDRIDQARGQVRRTEEQILRVLNQLEVMISDTRTEMAASRSALNHLIMNA